MPTHPFTKQAELDLGNEALDLIIDLTETLDNFDAFSYLSPSCQDCGMRKVDYEKMKDLTNRTKRLREYRGVQRGLRKTISPDKSMEGSQD